MSYTPTWDLESYASAHAGDSANRDHPRGTRTHVGRRETRRNGLVTHRAWIRRDANRRVVVRGTENDRFVRADGREIENRGGARHQEERARTRTRVLAKMRDQRFLRGLVEP